MNTLQLILFFAVIMALASLGVALISISVAFSYKKAYDKKREESKEALKKYVSVQHDLTLKMELIQDLQERNEKLRKKGAALDKENAELRKELEYLETRNLVVESEFSNYKTEAENEIIELREVVNHYEVNRQNQEIFREQIAYLLR